MSMYITPVQVQERTRITDLQGLGVTEIEKLITEAEALIDAYCGAWHKQDEAQIRTFPRIDDDGITSEITDATFAVVEQLFLLGAPSLAGTVTEERIGDYSYKTTQSADRDSIPQRAKTFLQGFRRRTGKINLITE